MQQGHSIPIQPIVMHFFNLKSQIFFIVFPCVRYVETRLCAKFECSTPSGFRDMAETSFRPDASGASPPKQVLLYFRSNYSRQGHKNSTQQVKSPQELISGLKINLSSTVPSVFAIFDPETCQLQGPKCTGSVMSRGFCFCMVIVYTHMSISTKYGVFPRPASYKTSPSKITNIPRTDFRKRVA